MEPTLRERIQAALVQDVDGVWESFVAEHGAEDRPAFVRHLVAWRLIPEALGDQLLASEAVGHDVVEDDVSAADLEAGEPADEIQDATTIMQWDGSSPEVDPDSATFQMDRRSVLQDEAAFDDGLLDEPRTEVRPLPSVNSTPGTAAAPAAKPEPASSGRASSVPGKAEPAPSSGPSESPPTGSAAAAEIDPEGDTLQVESGLLTPTPAPRTSGPAKARAARPPAARPDWDPADEAGDVVGQDALAVNRLIRDPVLERKLIVRTMLDDAAGQEALVRRFENELRITAQLDHPGVPAVIESRGRRAYLLRAHDGRPLASVLAEVRASYEARRPVPPSLEPTALLERLARACEVVGYAHARGVVHRDLNPNTVLFGGYGGVWVVGWGVARVFDPKAPSPVVADDSVHARATIGTPGYCSPEQAAGKAAELDARSDVYSLGLLLFEILTLRPAVSGSSPSARLARQQQAEVDPVVHFYGLPIEPAFKSILATALSIHPADRYTSATALAEDVRRALRSAPLSGQSEPVARTVGRWVGRYAGFVVLLIAGLLAAWALTFAALVAQLTGPWAG